MYDYVIKYKAMFKKDRPTVDDIPDNMDSMEVVKATPRKEITSRKRKRNEQKKFEKWQEEMWANFEINMAAREIANRPKYINYYDKASKNHLKSYKNEFKY